MNILKCLYGTYDHLDEKLHRIKMIFNDSNGKMLFIIIDNKNQMNSTTLKVLQADYFSNGKAIATDNN